MNETPGKRALTARQLEVLRWIADSTESHGYAPTIREIGDALGIVSTNGVVDHLKALARKGAVTSSPIKSRTLRVTPAGQEVLRRAGAAR